MQFFAEDTTPAEASMSDATTQSADDLDFDTLFEESADTDAPAEDQTQPDGALQTGQEDEPPAPPDGQPAQEEPAYKVKYNGREFEMPVSELIVNAQKGMNYDKVYAEREALRQSKEFAVLDQLAGQYGMDRAQYVDYLAGKLPELALRREQQALAERYPAADEQLLGTLAQQSLRLRQQQLAEQQAQAEAARRQPWREFFSEHPEIKADQLDDGFFERVRAGEAPMQVWLRMQNEQLQQRLAADRQNAQNRQRAIGSQRSEAPAEDGDAFLAGFLSI